MVLGEVLQTSQANANNTFAKLLNTTSGAVKTREKLFAELKAEIEHSVNLEERYLLPVLRKHQETKNRVPAATRANNRLRSKLAELDTLPKNDETFIQKLQDLKKGLRQYVRDEKQVLPGAFRAATKEQVQEAAGKIETGRAEGEQTKRDQAEKEGAERQIRDTREISKERTTAAADDGGARRITETVANGAHRTTAGILNTLEIYRGAARHTGQGCQAVAAFSRATTGGITEIGSAWAQWLHASSSAGARLAEQLIRCRTVQELAETQVEFLAGSTRSWMEHNARLLQVSRRVADEGLRALGGRLGH
jgi:hypothetical protein